MPASYLARHRPICAVLAEIREIAERYGNLNGTESDGYQAIIKLTDEAIEYAQRMSAKLVEYKEKLNEQTQ